MIYFTVTHAKLNEYVQLESYSVHLYPYSYKDETTIEIKLFNIYND